MLLIAEDISVKWSEQTRIFEQMVAEETELLDKKGREYAADDDALHNFKSKVDIGVSPLQVAMIFMDKHYSSIKSYVKLGHELSEESIEGRIHDMRNYLALLYMLIQESKNSRGDNV
jgi:hypothetical protein